jgi:hypothetical protein
VSSLACSWLLQPAVGLFVLAVDVVDLLGAALDILLMLPLLVSAVTALNISAGATPVFAVTALSISAGATPVFTGTALGISVGATPVFMLCCLVSKHQG